MMNKTIYLLLLTCLVGACVATKEVSIPLTNAPEWDYKAIAQMTEAPMLPREIKNIHHIDIPDTFRVLPNSNEIVCPAFVECTDQIEPVPLEPIPGINASYISNYEVDGNYIFLTLRCRTLIRQNKDTTEYAVSDRYAIYTRKGKFVSLLGTPHEEGTEKRYPNGMKVSNPQPDNRDSELQYDYYYTSLKLNRQAKELWLAGSESRRNLCFDYHGNYLRTTYFPFRLHGRSAFNTRGRWVVSNGDRDDNSVYLILDDSLRVSHRAVLGKGFDIRHPNQQCDNVFNSGNNYDTIWHILPDRMVARYVLTGNLKSRPFNITHDITAEKKALPYYMIKSGYTQVNDRYLFLTIDRVYDLAGSSKLYHSFHYLYDSATAHSMCFKRARPEHTTFTSEVLETYATKLELMPDGRLLTSVSAYDLKKRMSHILDQPSEKQRIMITKKEEKFVRSLSPDQMVLFFVKLKKF